MKNKKVLSFLLSLLIVLQFFVPGYKVQAETTGTEISYSISGDTIVGSTFDINVNISNAVNLYGASIDFKYDPSLIEIISVNRGSLISNASMQEPVKSIENGQASLGVTFTGEVSGISGSGTLFTIKAKALKEGIIELKTIADNSDLSITGNNVRVKLSNREGSSISYISRNNNINILTPAKRIEEDNSSIVYSGTWNNESNAGYSNSKSKYTNSSDASLSFSFSGTGIKLISSTGPNRGIAKITIDGVSQNIDLFSSSFASKKVVFEKSNLTQGTHNIKIESTATKNPSSSGYYLIIDAFDIINGDILTIDAPTKRVEEDNLNIVYSGTWNNESNAGYSNSKSKYTNSSDASLSFSFSGTGIKLISSTGPNRGIAKITIDGVSQNIDLFSSSFASKKVVFEKYNLTQGTHNIKIESTATKNPSSSGYYLIIDAFDIINGDILTIDAPTKRVEEDNLNIVYSGTWNNESNAGYSSSKGKYTNSSDASLSFSFSGTGIKLISITGPNRGIAKITIDGVSQNIDLFSSSFASKKVVFEKYNLTQGTHNIKIESTATKNPSSSGYYLIIDAFDIVNGDILPPDAPTKRVEEDNPSIVYSGTWNNESSTAYSNSKGKYTNSSDANLSFSFSGTGIKLISSTGPNRGIAKITIDGVSQNIDLFSSSFASKKVVFEKSNLTQSTHNIKIESTATKNPSSSGYYLIIDAFDIINGDILTIDAPTKRVEENNLNIVYSGTWNNESNAGYSSSKGKYTNSSDASLSFSFSGTSIKLISSTGPNRGIAKVSVDGVSQNIDLFSSSFTYKKVVFEKYNLTQGTHTIKIESIATKNPNSSDYYLIIDAFDIVNGDIL